MKILYQICCFMACISTFLVVFINTDLQTYIVPVVFLLIGTYAFDLYDGNIKKYYLNRIWKVGIPFLIISFGLLVAKIGFSVSFGFMKDFAKGICFGTIDNRLGFVYELFVFYLILPALSVMISVLDEKSKKVFIGILIGYFILLHICTCTGLQLFIVGYPFLNHIGYSLLGCFGWDLIIKKRRFKCDDKPKISENQTISKTYRPTYGLLRIIACFSVVFHHFIAPNQQYINTLDHSWLFTMIDNLLMCNNGLFFMLSGKFVLEQYDGRIGHFYKNKLLKIVLPFFLVSVYFYMFGGNVPKAEQSIQGFLKAILAGDIQGYLWFVYSLVGFYMVVPFFAPMLKAMSEKEKSWFIFILIAAVFLRNVCAVSGVPFVLGSFPFFHCVYILLGYLIDHINLNKKREMLIYVFAVPAMFISCCMAAFRPGMNPDIHDYCISRILMCCAVFLFISRRTNSISEYLKTSVKWISNQTYYIYLVHAVIQTFFFSKLWNLWAMLVKLPFILSLFVGSLVIFVLSLPLAYICQKIVHIFLKSLQMGIVKQKKA